MNPPRPPRVLAILLALGLGFSGVRGADLPSAADLRGLFIPPENAAMSLAPDGRHVAFVVYVDDVQQLAIMDVDQPATPFMLPLGKDIPPDGLRILALQPRLGYLAWISPTTLAYQVTVPDSTPGSRASSSGPLRRTAATTGS